MSRHPDEALWPRVNADEVEFLRLQCTARDTQGRLVGSFVEVTTQAEWSLVPIAATLLERRVRRDFELAGPLEWEVWPLVHGGEAEDEPVFLRVAVRDRPRIQEPASA